jgi:hypothetical protein
LANVLSRFFLLEQAKELWELWLARLQPTETDAAKERREIAKLAKVEELNPLYDLSFIDQYAKTFGQLPRVVRKESFDDVMPFFYLWLKQGEYAERYEQVEKEMKGTSHGNNKGN